MTTANQDAIADLQARYQQFKSDHPQLRIRNIADALEVSELELVALNCGPHSEGYSVQRLDNRPGVFRQLISEIRELGYVMALTRNDTVVHEKTAPYGKLGGGEQVGLFLGDIDLRIFFSRWRYGFHVLEGERRSLQFFDATGTAVHKIYANDQTDILALDALIERYLSDNQQAGEWINPKLDDTQDQQETVADKQVDLPAFHQDWDALQDVHDFLALLKKHRLERQQAFRLAGPERAQPMSVDVLEQALVKAAEQALPVMIFVANAGMVQIHTGPVKRLMRRGPWFNVLDPGFNLHANTEAFSQVWRVVRPTEDGPVSSLEVFDLQGALALQMFGARKPGQPERIEWQQLLQQLL